MTLKISKGLRLHQPQFPSASVPHITGTGEQRHMGRSGDRYELDIPEFNWNVGADAMRQDAHTSTTARIES
jgi:hypothetical protein